MDTIELLEKAKKNSNLASDYALAKKMEVSTGRISSYRSGKEHPGTYETTRLALLAGLNVVETIAEMEEQHEKNEKKKEFWRDFRQHAGKAAMIVLALNFTVSSSQGVNDFNHNRLTDHPIMRS